MAGIMRMLLIAAVLVLPCCDDGAGSRGSIVSVIPDTDSFSLTACASDGFYSVDKTSDWNCTAGQADIVFDSREGSVAGLRIAVRDGLGSLVFERIYESFGDSFISEKSSEGAPGKWSVDIQIIGLKGRVDVSASAR